MADKLEIFITEHRKEFDTLKAPKELWSELNLQLEQGKSNWIKSKWLSKFKFFGFGTVVLFTTVYFILHVTKQKNVSVKENNTTSVIAKETGVPTNSPNESVENKSIQTKTNSTSGFPHNGIKKQEQIYESSENQLALNKEGNTTIISFGDSTKSAKTSNGVFLENTNANLNEEETKSSIGIPYTKENEDEQRDEADKSPKTKKGFSLFKGRKGKNSNLTDESTDNDNYNCTLYKTTPCSVMSSFKFSGKGHMDGTMKSEGCNNLPSNVHSVWIHGTTKEKFILSISNGFKNIKLIKPDGKILNPIAISHFNNNSGIITYYSGKYFNLSFDDKVEIIFFFQGAEAGDKIVIDHAFESIIKK